jgi:hypothetical protein
MPARNGPGYLRRGEVAQETVNHTRTVSGRTKAAASHDREPPFKVKKPCMDSITGLISEDDMASASRGSSAKEVKNPGDLRTPGQSFWLWLLSSLACASWGVQVRINGSLPHSYHPWQ